MLGLITAVWLGVSPAPGNLGLESPREPTPIVGGGPVEPGTWNEVLGIQASGFLCTGILIQPRIVLTAAHCLKDINRAVTYFGDDIDSPTVVNGVQWAAHPDFCPTCSTEIFDYGYIILDRTIDIGKPFPEPITDQDEWDEFMQVGQTVSLVGFGTDDSPASEGFGLGIKRIVETEITDLTVNGRELRAGTDGKDSCGGDSGGPAMIRLEDGRWRVAGVLSRGTNPCGNGGYYGVPYPALEWLQEETGYDVLEGECESFRCLQLAEPVDEGCGSCRAQGDRTSVAWLVLLLLGARPRRRTAAESRSSATIMGC